jgi:hypothetical protein
VSLWRKQEGLSEGRAGIPLSLPGRSILRLTEPRELLSAKHKRWCFEEAIENASKGGGKSFCRSAKWVKSKSFISPTPPSIPPLTTPQGPATTLEAKCHALKARFFLPIPLANLSDISEFQYPAQKTLSPSITVEEIAFALSNAPPHKAPGPDGIPMYFLKLLGRPLLKYLQHLF